MAASARIDATAVYRMVCKAIDDACLAVYEVIDENDDEVENPRGGVQVRVTATGLVPGERQIGVDEADDAALAVVCMVRVTAAAMRADPLLCRKACSKVAAALDEVTLDDSASGWGGTNHVIQFQRAEIESGPADEQTRMGFGSVTCKGVAQRQSGTSLQ